jgi:uncharacterized protein (TIGR03085 family)
VADKLGYDGLVRAFRDGPPRLSPFALSGIDEAANTVEYFIHHEDVRRAVPDWAPRDIPAGLADALWGRLKSARLFPRRAPVGVQLAWDGAQDDARGDVGSPVLVKKAAPVVTVTGTPAELTMWVMGRASAANVAFDGPPDAVARPRDWRPA